MWVAYAFASALFAATTAILAKCGVRQTDSNVAAAVRTVVVLCFAWGIVFLTGAQAGIAALRPLTLLFLVLSGLCTGASWLCYFKALQLGDVNKVVPVDKASVVLTIILAFVFFQERVSLPGLLGVAAIAIGTYLMIEKQAPRKSGAKKGWLFYAAGAAVFASLTSILGKLGVRDVDSNLGTAIRTGVVLALAFAIVFATGRHRTLRRIPRRDLLFICLSGVATGASWLCYYRALQEGPASVVVPIDKLSILLTVAFSALFLKERLSRKALLGLLLVAVGTLALLV